MTIALPKSCSKQNLNAIRVALPKILGSSSGIYVKMAAPGEADWQEAKSAFGFREDQRAAFMAGALWMLKSKQG